MDKTPEVTFYALSGPMGLRQTSGVLIPSDTYI